MTKAQLIIMMKEEPEAVAEQFIRVLQASEYGLDKVESLTKELKMTRELLNESYEFMKHYKSKTLH